MKIFSKIIILVLVVVALVAGVFYYSLDKKTREIKTTDVGSVLSQVSKQLFAPPPLTAYKKTDSAVLLQSKIILETNSQRQQNGGLPALKENAKLDEAALAKANDIFLKQYFEHVSPSGVGPGDLAQKYGYEFIVEGENLILGNFSSEKEVVQDWMNSPGHRANILNNRYTEIGVAIIKGTYKGDTVWVGVQEFGLPLSACTQPSVSLKNQIDADNSQLDITLAQINEGKNQIDNTSPQSAGYNQLVKDYNDLVVRYNALASETKAIVATYNIQVNNYNNCVAGK